MSSADPGGPYLHDMPAPVLFKFCVVMDGLSDLDWCRFASLVLIDQTSLRLAQRMERRTDWVMNHWAARNGRVGELVDLLERMQLFRPRDVIRDWLSDLRPSSPHPPFLLPPLTLPQFEPPPKQPKAPPTEIACSLLEGKGGGGPLPRPAPPPAHLHSAPCRPPEHPPLAQQRSELMCWSYEEVHEGTDGFSPSRQVGEGGFGVVYEATLSGTECAVKRLKQDSVDWTQLKKSFQTEVDKLTTFRHPNIVDLLGFSEGPECVCLIYSYMENRSLEDQLHNESRTLSWSERVSVVEGASKALRYLHGPPKGHAPLIHGDVKSSNILLDCNLVAKLADFGLARYACRRSVEGSAVRSAAETTMIGKTETVRGTLAYLPVEYVRNGQLGTAVDVYSFGVVLLEVLTGRRAMERDRESRERYLKDLVEKVEDSPAGSCAAEWRKQLDHRLISGGAAEPAGFMEMVDLACMCLKFWKMRPKMAKVFEKLQYIHSLVRKSSCSSSYLHNPHLQPPSLPRPPHPLDSSVEALSQQMSKLGPLEDTYRPSMSSSSSSSFCSLTPPDPLHSYSSLPSSSSSSSSLPPSSSSLPPCSSSFVGPCETDESRGFSQYDLRSQCRSNGTSSRSLSPCTRDQNLHPPRPSESLFSQPSFPTENSTTLPPSLAAAGTVQGFSQGGAAGGATAGLYGVPGSLSPMGSLKSSSPGPQVVINPSKQRLLQKKTLYDEGRIQTPELLSADDLYEGRSSEEGRGPEESDELDYLPVAKHS
ncbi:LOW QUALITY PROTEIN: interleukin-1 receptor-associated kinase 1 [Tautogolabrus adspersus]